MARFVEIHVPSVRCAYAGPSRTDTIFRASMREEWNRYRASALSHS
jgi:hypothetical protein